MTPDESVRRRSGSSVRLLVVYTTRLEECHAFYSSLGLTFVPEKHGRGPRHYAAVLSDGCVMELYPATSPERATGRMRLGLALDAPPSSALRPNDDGTYTDPDGRTVDVVNWGNNPEDG
ncbi:glyoxalase/bleomycin resistance/dioxygenase family protein [Spiractinospora alimapuensis]|uniref:glyoxalase/bleomycin resistance/dioxygenase family protein n=1 Tax=Spiractinospora alimapuensis TaxID=2820884 RepID=UPI001F24F22A|nr:glyoxalase/bleomycin resistance/dioxygenase family protein [Spiractinospora alimapuensis]QVQ50009.1 glyoxalase/bleomycin resistance/dioxygenase family protein [Spiractinospora alimapuensis]